MRNNKLVILGAGIVGRFAKILLPEAELLEAKQKDDKFTAQYLGANMSRLPVPELGCQPVMFHNLINGKIATIEDIKRYKKSKTGEGDIKYGDIKQFIPKHLVYTVSLPEVPALYNTKVKQILINEKKIILESGGDISYDCIINTIPLNILLRLIDLWEDTNIVEISNHLLANKPIYYKEEMVSDAERKLYLPNEIYANQKIDDTIYYREIFHGGKKSTESFFQFEGATKIFPGKIIPSSNSKDIIDDLKLYQIYCYGRYAKWLPTEFLHETFKNLRRFQERFGQVGYC